MEQPDKSETPQSELARELHTFFPQLTSDEIARFEAYLHEQNFAEERNGYRLTFVGRDYAHLQAGQPSALLISPDAEHNALPENAQSDNVFITGDNLEALRHLQNAYAGKIKMIYIDPPYNTGAEFVYADHFELTDEKLKNALGYSDEEIARLKSIQGKSSHSAWLTFMCSRLMLTKKLLTDDGVIFVSIDDNEQANLKLLMDDIFGEGNSLGLISVVNNLKGRSDEEFFATSNEFLLCYAKDSACASIGGLELPEDMADEYKLNDGISNYKEVSLQKTGKNSRRVDRPRMYYAIWYNPATAEFSAEETHGALAIYPTQINGSEGRWRWGKEKFIANKESELVARQVGDNWRVYVKMRDVVDGKQRTLKPKTTWIDPKYDTGNGGRVVKELLGHAGLFDNPKSHYYIMDILGMATTGFDDLVLDFFAGSGTTAHAVMQLNAEDGGNRKWIMVQLDEETNPTSEARKAGYATIDQISRERIRRAATKIKTGQAQKAPDLFAGEPAALDTGFKHYRLREPDVTPLDKIETFDQNLGGFEDMVTPMGGEETLLTTWLIDDGYPFDTRVEPMRFAGYTARYVAASQTLYVIERGLTTDALKEMLNRIGCGELIASTIVVYPYSVGFEQMRELDTGVKQVDGLTLKKRY